jgi:hypothetical protein
MSQIVDFRREAFTNPLSLLGRATTFPAVRRLTKPSKVSEHHLLLSPFTFSLSLLCLNYILNIDSTATDANHPRIEEAFRKYFHRAPFPEVEVDPAKDENALAPTEKDETPEEEKHEFEIIVCHANVIRYFLCR